MSPTTCENACHHHHVRKDKHSTVELQARRLEVVLEEERDRDRGSNVGDVGVALQNFFRLLSGVMPGHARRSQLPLSTLDFQPLAPNPRVADACLTPSERKPSTEVWNRSNCRFHPFPYDIQVHTTSLQGKQSVMQG